MGYMRDCDRKIINIPREDLELFEKVSTGETLSEGIRKAFKMYLQELREEPRKKGIKA